MARRNRRWSVLAVVLLGAARPSGAGEVAPDVVTVVLKDEGQLVGTIVADDETALTLRLASGEELRLLRDSITRVDSGAPTNRRAWSERSDPNDTRLMFAPTGRPLRKGDAYVSNHYALFPGFAYGLTNNLSVAGGFSTIPGVGLDDQVFYVSSQLGVRLSDKAALSCGALYAGAGEDVHDAAVVYGVTSWGRPDRSLTLGFGLALTREQEERFGPRGQYLDSTDRWRSAPIVMVGGTFRLAKPLALVTESWLLLREPLSAQPFGLALRFFGERISVDAGFVFVPEVLHEGFPIPWLSFSYHFGSSRSAARRAPFAMAASAASRPRVPRPPSAPLRVAGP